MFGVPLAGKRCAAMWGNERSTVLLSEEEEQQVQDKLPDH